MMFELQLCDLRLAAHSGQRSTLPATKDNSTFLSLPFSLSFSLSFLSGSKSNTRSAARRQKREPSHPLALSLALAILPHTTHTHTHTHCGNLASRSLTSLLQSLALLLRCQRRVRSTRCLHGRLAIVVVVGHVAVASAFAFACFCVCICSCIGAGFWGWFGQQTEGVGVAQEHV